MSYSTLLDHQRSNRAKVCCVIASIASLLPIMLWEQAVHALQFNFGTTSSLPPEVVTGLDYAGKNWSDAFTDDVTVDLNIFFSSDLEGLGAFQARRVNVSYRNFFTALRDYGDRSPSDEIAQAFLPKSNNFDLLLSPEFDLLINGTRNHPSGHAGDLTPYLDNDGDCNNRSIRLTTANAKALGLPSSGTWNCARTPEFFADDGYLMFSNRVLWDFDPTDGIKPGHYDFVGVATQGLGMSLGMISGVDVLDSFTPLPSDPNGRAFDDDLFAFVSPVDLFRFSEDSLDVASGQSSQSIIDWTTGRKDAQGDEVDKYFSIDGGQTAIASFSTGRQFGDGNRPSSWKADELTGDYLGVFDPTPAQGEQLFVTENDRQLLDVIGWDLDPAYWSSNPGSGGNPPPSGGNPPPSGGNPPPSGGNPPPLPGGGPDSVAVPEAGHGLGVIVLAAIALGRWAKGRLSQ